MVGGATGNGADTKEEQEWREAGGGDSQDPVSNSSFLPELNLLFVLLSLVPSNSDEDSNGDNGELRMKELETSKVCNTARSSVKKKDVIDAKPEGRRIPQRFHTTIKDHRFFLFHLLLHVHVL